MNRQRMGVACFGLCLLFAQLVLADAAVAQTSDTAVTATSTEQVAAAESASEERSAMLTPLGTTQLVQSLLGLSVVLAVIVVLAWAVKRFGRLSGAGNGGVEIEGGVSLGPRERAVLLNVAGTRLLVGVAPGRVQTLHVVSQPLDKRRLDEEIEFERDLLKAVNDGIRS